MNFGVDYLRGLADALRVEVARLFPSEGRRSAAPSRRIITPCNDGLTYAAAYPRPAVDPAESAPTD